LEVGAEGGFKLDLRLDCDPGRLDHDPGKQKLKVAVRTETYQHHYCQQLYFVTLEVNKIHSSYDVRLSMLRILYVW
jgi:hypothetical protein